MRKISEKINVESILRYELFIAIGFLLVFGTLARLSGFYNFSSD